MATSADTRRYSSLLFIGALAVLFALQWGPGSSACDIGKLPERETAATVNGEVIPLTEFARTYGQQADQFRRQGIPTEMLKQFGIDRQVIDQMVNTELLAQAAERRGVAADDEDLIKALRQIPSFQKDGQFDPATYKLIIQQYEGTTEVQFEDKLRRQLSAQRLIDLVESSVSVSDDEVHAHYLQEADTANVTFVRFVPAMYTAQVKAPKPAEVEAWAKAHEADIETYYQQNELAYSEPEKVKARQILLRFPDGATDAQKADVKARAEAARKDIVEGGKTFADVARETSDDATTKGNGGDLGLVERLALPGAFADVLFALKPGEVSVPVETGLGYYVGTVEEKKEAQKRPLADVRTEIAGQLLVKSQASALARAAAEKALADMKAGAALGALFPAAPSGDSQSPFGFAQATAPEAKQTGDFNATADAIPLLGAAPEVQKRIFEQTGPGPLDELVPAGDSFAVLHLDARHQASDDDFSAKKAQMTLEAVKGKQFEVREAFLKALKQSGTVVINDKAISGIVENGS